MEPTPLQLSPDQQAAFEQLKAFLGNKELNTCILNGRAGTGKTTLIQHFARWLEEEEHPFKLLASTGRASAVLRGKTNLSTQTLHSAVYTFKHLHGNEEEEEETGQYRLVFEVRSEVEPTLYIVDEASMVGYQVSTSGFQAEFGSGSLLADFFEVAGRASKVIFIGDDAQLPPVTEKESPALSETLLRSLGRKVMRITLHTNQRVQSGNDLRMVQGALLTMLGWTSFPKWIKLPVLNRQSVVVYPDEAAMFDAFYAKMSAGDSSEVMGIGYNNVQCRRMNEAYRTRKYGAYPALLYPGERLMVQQNSYVAPLTNGDFISLVSQQEQSVLVGSKIALRHVVVQGWDQAELYSLYLAENPLRSGNPNFTQDEFMDLMIDFSRRMKARGVSRKSPLFQRNMEDDPKLNALRVGYGYVVTCHKAQGGEWDDVFLFLDQSIYGGRTKLELIRWWYTAVTRARKRLHVAQGWWLQ
jgi:hypothetical protein